MQHMKLAAGSFEYVQRAIRRYWCSDNYSIDPETLRIMHPNKGMNGTHAVRRYRDGYVFERVQP